MYIDFDGFFKLNGKTIDSKVRPHTPLIYPTPRAPRTEAVIPRKVP